MSDQSAMLADLDRMRAGALPVHCVTLPVTTGPGTVPIFHVDAAGHPDIQDLPRAIQELAGVPRPIDGGWGWGIAQRDVEVMICASVTSPVRCSFVVWVSVRQHGQALLKAIDRRLVLLSTVCPEGPNVPMIGLVPGHDASKMVREVVEGVQRSQWSMQ